MALSPPDPRVLLREAGLSPKKAWGQNFLCDQVVLAAIADATGAGPGVPVVELGAGLGALTFHLLLRGGRVIAIERDRELAPLLREALVGAVGTEAAGAGAGTEAAGAGAGAGTEAAGAGAGAGTEATGAGAGTEAAGAGTAGGAGTEARLEIVEADAAGIDYGQLAERLGARPAVCGNLPYQLSSRIIVSIADQVQEVRRAVLMVQREVADRLVAAPGGRTFGLLSVLVQRAFDVEIVRRVPAGAFHPRPKVTSAVVRLEPLPVLRGPVTDRRLVAAARAAFATRRKTLKNSLSRALSADGEIVAVAIVSAGLDPKVRAEVLSVDDFARLGGALADSGLLD